MEAEVIEFPRRPPRSANQRNPRGSILMAAMIGLADAIGLDQQQKDDVVQVADAPKGDGGLVLRFGELDPLE